MADSQDRWGYVNSRGGIAIAFEFEHAFRFHEGKGRVCVSGHCGFVGENGRMVIPPVFIPDGTGTFSEGRAAAQIESSRVGYIDGSGEFVIVPKFDMAYPFCDGLACVQESQIDGMGLFGFVDLDGNWAIPPRFIRANNFSEGLATMFVDGVMRFMDRSGRLLDRDFEDAGSFHRGFAPARSCDGWGIVDRDMNLRLLGVDSVFTGSDGRYLVVKFDGDSTPRYGFVDSQCTYVVPPTLEDASLFSGGRAAARANGKWGYLNVDGQWAIEPMFTRADSFSGGLAQVEIDETVGYVDESGRWVFGMDGFVAFDFQDGLAPAYQPVLGT